MKAHMRMVNFADSFSTPLASDGTLCYSLLAVKVLKVLITLLTHQASLQMQTLLHSSSKQRQILSCYHPLKLSWSSRSS